MNKQNKMSVIGDNDALPLEYKLLNWQPLRQVDISHFVGDSALKGFLRADVGCAGGWLGSPARLH